MLFRNILVPVDFSERSLPALALALDLACEAQGGRITLCHVATPEASVPTPAFERLLERVDLGRAGVDVVTVGGEPATAILNLAKEGRFDSIVLGTRSRMGVADYLLGSVSMRVITHAPCPVITVAPDMAVAQTGESWLGPNHSFVD